MPHFGFQPLKCSHHGKENYLLVDIVAGNSRV